MRSGVEGIPWKHGPPARDTSARAGVTAFRPGRWCDEHNLVGSAALGCINGHPGQAKRKSRLEQSPARSLPGVRHIDCTTPHGGTRHGHKHRDLADDLGLPLKLDKSSAVRPRKSSTSTAGDSLGVRETSGTAALCDRTGGRGMRILGSRGSGRFGLDSMTPKRGNAMAEHRGDGRRVQTLIVTAAVVLVTAAAAAQGDAPEAPATVKEVMVTMTIPSSDAIFDAAYEPPNDDEQWVAVRKNAVMLVESGKLLMTSETRQGQYNLDGDGSRTGGSSRSDVEGSRGPKRRCALERERSPLSEL